MGSSAAATALLFLAFILQLSSTPSYVQKVPQTSRTLQSLFDGGLGRVNISLNSGICFGGGLQLRGGTQLTEDQKEQYRRLRAKEIAKHRKKRKMPANACLVPDDIKNLQVAVEVRGSPPRRQTLCLQYRRA